MITTPDLSGNGKGVAFVAQSDTLDILNNLNRVGSSARVTHEFNASLHGTFVATLKLERSYDNGLNWSPITALGNTIQFTAPCEEIFDEPQNGVIYRWNCIAYTSGTITARISQ